MSSSNKKSSSRSGDLDLASLVSNIKKNVGAPQTGSGAVTSSSTKASSSSSGNPKTQKSSAKPSSKELDKELRKKQGKEKSSAVAESGADDLPKPKERKRPREDIQSNPEAEEEMWDDTFEKDDIEDIFGQLKTSKEARLAAAKQSEDDQASLQKLLDRAATRSSNNSVAIRQSSVKRDPKRRYTEDGLPIYTTEELGLSTKGGDTALCPFDCDCCY